MTSKKPSTRWIVIAVPLLVLAVFGLWYAASPWWTLSRMQNAADAGDADTLAGYIDFPAFRADLKTQLDTELAAEGSDDSTGLSQLATVIGGALIGPAVDMLVTPTSLRAAFATSELADAGDIAQARPLKLGKDPVITRRGLGEFSIAPRGSKNALIFRFEGLGWKLSGIELTRRAPAVDPADTI